MSQPGYVDRLKVSWFILWRVVLLSMLIDLATGFGVVAAGFASEVMLAIAHALVALLALFVITPWVVGRLERKRFRGFRVELVHNGRLRY